jgi:7-cyano-7-deazaguanine synthase
VVSERSVLLLSGGLDSTALAAIHRPASCVVVDYGQRCATAETQAATAVAKALRLPVRTLSIDLRNVGAGLLHSDEPIAGAPSREWWPYRNQLLVTVAAAVALREHLDTVLIGSVKSDGARHVDGTAPFYESLDQLVSMQEGGIRVCAPGLHHSTAELITCSGLGEDVLGWTVSCHRASFPCGTCPGCHKRAEVLTQVGILCGANKYGSK